MPVKASSSIKRLQVVADAEGLTSRAGTALVAAVADRVGLTAGLSNALAGVRERRSRHDPGRVRRGGLGHGSSGTTRGGRGALKGAAALGRPGLRRGSPGDGEAAGEWWCPAA